LVDKPSDPQISTLITLQQTFPNLRTLWLTDCTVTEGFIASLQQCTQLSKLALVECRMQPDALSALSSLHALPSLEFLRWHQPKGRRTSPGVALRALAQLTQLTELALAYNHHAIDKAALSTLVAVPSKMHRLQHFEILPVLTKVAEKEPEAVNLESIPIWDQLSIPELQQLLTSCSMLTSLVLFSVVLDQAGLDLLLAHPHCECHPPSNCSHREQGGQPLQLADSRACKAGGPSFTGTCAPSLTEAAAGSQVPDATPRRANTAAA
jgi:hypothetical protein